MTLDIFTILCKDTHYQIDSLPRYLSTVSVEKLAIACNKYNCVSTFRHLSMVWLHALINRYPPDHYLKLLFP
jgi:hypothetical protein